MFQTEMSVSKESSAVSVSSEEHIEQSTSGFDLDSCLARPVWGSAPSSGDKRPGLPPASASKHTAAVTPIAVAPVRVSRNELLSQSQLLGGRFPHSTGDLQTTAWQRESQRLDATAANTNTSSNNQDIIDTATDGHMTSATGSDPHNDILQPLLAEKDPTGVENEDPYNTTFYTPDLNCALLRVDCSGANGDEGVVVSTPHHNEAHLSHKGQSPIRRVLYNMLMTVLGAGIVGLPATMHWSGLLGSVVLILLFAFVSVYTLQMLIRAAKRANINNYEDLCEHCFGVWGYYYVSMCMFIFDFGAMISFLIILGDASSEVALFFGIFDADVWHKENIRRVCILTIACVVMLPAVCFRDMSRIEPLTRVAVISLVVITGVVIYEFIKMRIFGIYDYDDNSSANSQHIVEVNYGVRWSGLLPSLGVYAFAFVCHDSTFLLYNTLANPTTARWNRLSAMAIGIALTLCALFSVGAYLTFGSDTQPNVLNNYPQNDPFVIVARCLYAVTMTATYPCCFYVVRHVMYAMLFRGPQYQSIQECSLRTHLTFTSLLFIVTIGISMFVSDLGLVMSLCGSVAAVNLAFVLPSATYLKVVPFKVDFWNEPPEYRWQAFSRVVQPVFILILGLFLMIVATGYTLLESSSRDN